MENAQQERERLVESLIDVGSAWARYGLTMGRLALETSARTLTHSARALGTLAENIDPHDAEAEDDLLDSPRS